MKIFLLGASGFVGTNILPTLLEAGVEVIALCRDSNVKTKYPAVPGLSWMPIDEALQKPLTDIDSLLSFAGVGSPAAFERQADVMALAELGIAELIGKLTALHGLRSIQYLSTAGAVYGEGWVNEPGGGYGRIFTEDSECHPVSVYGRSKLAAEKHLESLLAASSPSTTLSILRVTNIYGLHYTKAGQQGLINALLDRWRQSLRITQYGDGLIYRDYLFSNDLATAHLNCLHKPVAGIFNIGAGYSLSILDIVAAVETAIGSRFDRDLKPSRDFDVRYVAVSIDKARTLLGWSPQVNIDEGIARLLAFQ